MTCLNLLSKQQLLDHFNDHAAAILSLHRKTIEMRASAPDTSCNCEAERKYVCEACLEGNLFRDLGELLKFLSDASSETHGLVPSDIDKLLTDPTAFAKNMACFVVRIVDYRIDKPFVLWPKRTALGVLVADPRFTPDDRKVDVLFPDRVLEGIQGEGWGRRTIGEIDAQNILVVEFIAPNGSTWTWDTFWKLDHRNMIADAQMKCDKSDGRWSLVPFPSE